MIKKILYIISVSLIIVTVSMKGLHALGLGGYLSGKGGMSTLTMDKTASSVDYGVGAGFVLDTAVATDKVMNYRLDMGYDNAVKSGIPFFSRWSMHRLSLANTIGFAFFKSTTLRLWMGPQIELACQFVKTKDKKTGIFENGFFSWSPIYKTRYHSLDYTIFTLGLGAVLGLNINTQGPFTMSIEIGVNTCVGIGPLHEKKREYVYAPGFFMPSLISSRARDTIFGKAEGLTRVSFMYRVDDRFVPVTPHNTDI
jgi:hypothetical protein